MIFKILQAKHWQVFLILFGLPFCLRFFFTNFVFVTPTSPNQEALNLYFTNLPYISLFAFLAICLWFWAVAIGLQKIIPPELQLNVKRFKIVFFITVFYMVYFMGFIENKIDFIFLNTSNVKADFVLSWYICTLLAHSFSILCILYSTYFVAKTITTAKLQRAVKSSDCGGVLLILWLLPIGIWFIQPLINKLVATQSVNPKSSDLLLDDELF